MSAKIIEFPKSPAEILQFFGGYKLIAFKRSPPGGCHYWALWKSPRGGWYTDAAHDEVTGKWFGCSLMYRKQEARRLYRLNSKLYAWHYCMTESEAFPEKRRYMRPPRVRMCVRAM